MVYSTRRFVLCLTLCYFVLVFFSPFSIAITSLGEERVNLRAFRTFVRFALVCFCLFPFPLGVWEGLRFVIVALPGLFSYRFLLGLKNEFESATVSESSVLESLDFEWLDGAKVSCILRHRGIQLILAYSWVRPAILVHVAG